MDIKSITQGICVYKNNVARVVSERIWVLIWKHELNGFFSMSWFLIASSRWPWVPRIRPPWHSKPCQRSETRRKLHKIAHCYANWARINSSTVGFGESAEIEERFCRDLQVRQAATFFHFLQFSFSPLFSLFTVLNSFLLSSPLRHQWEGRKSS